MRRQSSETGVGLLVASLNELVGLGRMGGGNHSVHLQHPLLN